MTSFLFLKYGNYSLFFAAEALIAAMKVENILFYRPECAAAASDFTARENCTFAGIGDSEAKALGEIQLDALGLAPQCLIEWSTNHCANAATNFTYADW